MHPSTDKLKTRIAELEKENARLRSLAESALSGDTVSVPDSLRPIFDVAQRTVKEYFQKLEMDPTKGTIEINDQRYVLVRASALSIDFLSTIQNLYSDRGEREAMSIGKNFLFDVAHVIGMNDAKNFHSTMNLTDPISKLSAGTVHFAYSGWAFVDIMPESNPSPDENFYLLYDHPYSFEADSWRRSGKLSETPVCIMNAGYSSGWCEESFKIPLTAVEVTCRAKGDDQCRFIMSPPEKIEFHLEQYHTEKPNLETQHYEVPTFFDRKRVEEEMHRARILAEASDKSKSDFIANVSHELRTPLNAILGFADLMKKTPLSSTQKDYMEAVSSSGKSLLSIINDILDLSKMDAGKFLIEHTPFDIRELLHSLQLMFATEAAAKEIDFICEVDKAVPQVLVGDPNRLSQVIVNLVGNALKFTGEGSVNLACKLLKEDASLVELAFNIKDTGIGIAADKRAAIFDRFTQADSNITRKYGGTGLGLAITKQLVELQGGKIDLLRTTAGAEFEVNIPYLKLTNKVEHENQAIETKADPPIVQRVLLVEDNLMNQKLAAIMFTENGIEYEVAANGLVAIEALKQRNFDVILMDLQMPLLDGYQATNIIRNELKLTTPIIAMTAHALSGEKESCIAAGMNDYLSKPYTEHDLLTRLRLYAQETALPKEPAGPGIIDLAFLKTQSRNNKKFILEMMGLLLQQHPIELAKLRKALIEKDHATVAKTTHTIRNTIAFFGLDKTIGAALLQMEKLARDKQPIEMITKLFGEVEPVCLKALRELNEFNPSLLD